MFLNISALLACSSTRLTYHLLIFTSPSYHDVQMGGWCLVSTVSLFNQVQQEHLKMYLAATYTAESLYTMLDKYVRMSDVHG